VQVEEILVTRKKVCITGKLDMTRSQLASILEEKGFQVTSTVTKDCYTLVAGDTTSSKYKKAMTIGVNVIDYWSSKKEVLSGNF
jgi:NAD-dependent DNA ligase